jgi:hypothetical protein
MATINPSDRFSIDRDAVAPPAGARYQYPPRFEVTADAHGIRGICSHAGWCCWLSWPTGWD